MINERLQRKSDKRILRIYFSFQVFLQWVMKLSSVCLWKESHSCLWIICLHTDPWIQHHRVEHRLHMDYTKTQNTETKSTEQLQKVPQDAWNKWPASFYFCLLHVVWCIFTFGRVFYLILRAKNLWTVLYSISKNTRAESALCRSHTASCECGPL